MSGVQKKINPRAVFKPRTKSDDNAELSNALIVSARRTGSLNLSSKGLFTVPNRVWSINELTEDELKNLHFELDYVSTEERWWEQEVLKLLDLSSNSLTVIDPKIECLADLTLLDLHNNLLDQLPRELGKLRKLEKLNMSCNKLEKLPAEFYNLSELRELDLKNNFLKELDPRIGDLIMLTRLNLSHNNLTELPIGTGYLVRLTSLDLSHNMLRELPPDTTSMRALQKLDASFNLLEVLPPLGELRKVESIMLQTNNLTTFPDVTGCTVLTELSLSDNSIKEINMSCLDGTAHIKKLTLRNNKITAIPEDIIQLVNLELFDISNNDVSVIPPSIGIMPNLKRVIVEGNVIQNIRSDIIRRGTTQLLKHIRHTIDSVHTCKTECSLSSSNVNVYPDRYTMKSTKLLSLAGKDLSVLPDEVLEDARLAEITTVDLSRNKLTELPKKLSEVTTVTDLKITSNRLVILPEWIGEKYNHLRVLNLNKNCLDSLPSSIGTLKNLREIDISFNRYTQLPESIYNVTSLEILIANDNLINNIDVSSLKKLHKLATLNLANNNISFVSPYLGNLTNLRRLLLSGNCFKHPRQAILTKSTEEILDYLRTRIPA